MLGSLTNYRRLLRDHVFAPKINGRPDPAFRLNAWQHGVAGVFAGWTVSLIASPFEHIKARLQIQYAADKHQRLYSGPIDCTRKIVCLGHVDLDLANGCSYEIMEFQDCIRVFFRL